MMDRLLGAFLVVHGLIHLAIWLAPASDDAPFDVRRSWLWGDLGATATLLGVLAGAGFVLAGGAVLLDASWWPVALVAATSISTLLLLLTFTPWWVLALAINLALGVLAARQ